jgi:hypothetical protein
MLFAVARRKTAKAVDMDDQGKMTVPREVTHGFTCFPGPAGGDSHQKDNVSR